MGVRPLTPRPGGEATFGVSAFTPSTVRPCGISNDRTTVYGSDKGTLKQSTDDGATWSTLFSFGADAGVVVTALVETDDGEAVAYLNNYSTGRVYRSSGWGAGHATATWSLVLSSPGGYPDRYTANAALFGDDAIAPGTGKYGLAAMYGPQTTSSGDQTTKGRYVYWTEDFGATWTLVFDIHTWASGKVNLHVHSAAYDPWWDRIWVVWGDAQVSGGLDVVYSDDHGATWSQLPGLPTWTTQGAGFQSTTVLPREEVVVFGSDPIQGLWVLPRKGYREARDPVVLAMHSTGTSNTSISIQTNTPRKTSGGPVTHCWDSQTATMRAGVAFSWNGGKSFHRVLDFPQSAVSSVDSVYGPTASGRYVIGCRQGSSYYLVRGAPVLPEAGTLALLLKSSGDGSTKVFRVPHYLGRAPGRVAGYAQSSAALAPFSVSSDASNVTATFSAPPANGSLVQVALILSGVV